VRRQASVRVVSLAVNVCFFNSFWLLCDYSDQLEDVRSVDGSKLFSSDPVFIMRFSIKQGLAIKQLSRCNRRGCMRLYEAVWGCMRLYEALMCYRPFCSWLNWYTLEFFCGISRSPTEFSICIYNAWHFECIFYVKLPDTSVGANLNNVRGMLKKRTDFLNSSPTSTESALRPLSAPSVRVWQQTAICPVSLWALVVGLPPLNWARAEAVPRNRDKEEIQENAIRELRAI
jgi:hypothetical protein